MEPSRHDVLAVRDQELKVLLSLVVVFFTRTLHVGATINTAHLQTLILDYAFPYSERWLGKYDLRSNTSDGLGPTVDG